MTCQDPFAKNLKDKGYNLVAYPKTSIKLLNLYQHTVDNKLKRWFIKSDAKPTTGFLKGIFLDNVSGAIGVSDGRGMNIDVKKTKKIDASIASKILGSYFQDAAPSFDVALENAASVIFHIEDIETTDADEIGLRNWLNNNTKKLQIGYEEEIRKGNFFVATSLLKAKKVRMQIERSNQSKAAVDMTKLAQSTLKFNSNNTENDELVFNSTDEGIVFGVKLIRLIFSSKGVLTIDNKQDFDRVLGNNMALNYFTSLYDSNFIEVE